MHANVAFVHEYTFGILCIYIYNIVVRVRVTQTTVPIVV